MSSNNNQATTGRNSFASRLLNKAIEDRKKTGEFSAITPADATKFATESPTESKETAAPVKN